LDFSQPTHHVTNKGSINVGPSGLGKYQVTGSGFDPNANILIRAMTTIRYIDDFPAVANGNGQFQTTVSFNPPSESPIFFAATDGSGSDIDLSGRRWSNTAQA